MHKKILFIIASEGYQPVEYGDAKKVLEEAGHQVITVSDRGGEAVAGNGLVAKVDVTVSELNARRRDLSLALSSADERENYDGLFFVGGAGALGCLDNEESYKLLREWEKTGKPYGAICISPRILAKAGVLKNKKATGWDGDGELEGVLSAHGAEYVRQAVVVDGNLVTGNGPSAARGWGERICEILTKR
jgi:protease I